MTSMLVAIGLFLAVFAEAVAGAWTVPKGKLWAKFRLLDMQEVRSSSLRLPTILTSRKHNRLREVSFCRTAKLFSTGKRMANERR